MEKFLQSYDTPTSSSLGALIDGAVGHHLLASDVRHPNKVTKSVWNESDDNSNDSLEAFASTSLIESIRSKIYVNHQSYPWESSFDQSLQDAELSESIQIFTSQVQSKVAELEFNLDGAFTSSSADQEETSDSLSLRADYSLPVADFSQFDPATWLRDIEKEALVVNSWQVEAEKLTAIAIAAFEKLKQNATDIMEDVKTKVLAGLMTNASAMYSEMEMRHDEHVRSQREDKLNSAESPLFHTGTWSSAGYEVENEIDSYDALAKIVLIPLKTYKLKDDKQQDVSVSRIERRTRYHVGPVGTENATDKFEPAAIFSYNVAAVAHLAKHMEELSSKLTTGTTFINHHSSLKDKISALKATTGSSDSYKTPAQMASEVAALETEAALKRIISLCHSLVQSTRINLVRSKLAFKLKSLATHDLSSERMSQIERDLVTRRELEADDTNAGLDTVLAYLNAIEEIKSAWNSTMRDLQELDETARIESRIATEEINAEAAAERENESTSLEQIKLIGNALTTEMIQAIENVFWHLAGCLHHLVSTPEGRHQFFFYVGAAAAMVFVASTMKEGISLLCLFILRHFTAPQLVREYGNLKMQPFSVHNAEEEEIVLPKELTERLSTIVQVASAASARGFPMKSILIHGQPGCGKSMVAKSLAQSTGLPYAMMSGGDVFPLKNQGPSELRRLLMWASKGRGSIIIIDEAECALGSRSKTKQETNTFGLGDDKKSSSAGYSRDCLNVLLSMTGTFGNIMLILTTSNPSELDEAVLDRMDEHIHLPLPSRHQRFTILNNAFFKVFSPHQIASSRGRWTSFLPKSLPNARFDKSFDVENSLSDVAQDLYTLGFSGRELKKMIQMILYKCHASDSGILDNALWKREANKLCEMMASKHLLRS